MDCVFTNAKDYVSPSYCSDLVALFIHIHYMLRNRPLSNGKVLSSECSTFGTFFKRKGTSTKPFHIVMFGKNIFINKEFTVLSAQLIQMF